MFNFIWKQETTPELLKIVERTNFKGFEQHFFRNPNGDYNHKQNFFIWSSKTHKHKYLRITLLSNEGLFFWNLETSFKPFAWKHNHRENANIKSNTFKSNDDDNYLSEFNKLVNIANKIINCPREGKNGK